MGVCMVSFMKVFNYRPGNHAQQKSSITFVFKQQNIKIANQSTFTYSVLLDSQYFEHVGLPG